MTPDILFLGIDIVTIALFLLVLVFSIGIVWRVEEKLDWSYKFFVVAAASIVLADVIGLYGASHDATTVLLGKGLRFFWSDRISPQYSGYARYRSEAGPREEIGVSLRETYGVYHYPKNHLSTRSVSGKRGAFWETRRV